eukprot:10623296-Lingulodinium_polyedra.AAC.1
MVGRLMRLHRRVGGHVQAQGRAAAATTGSRPAKVTRRSFRSKGEEEETVAVTVTETETGTETDRQAWEI